MVRQIKVFEGGQRPTEAADEMCQRLKEVVYDYSDRIPLALAIGVLEIAKREILDEST